MPEDTRRFKRYLTADEARSLIRARILAGLPVTARDIRALGYSLENARWSSYRREVEAELGLPHRRPVRCRLNAPATADGHSTASVSPLAAPEIPPAEGTRVSPAPRHVPAGEQKLLNRLGTLGAKRLFSTLARRALSALYAMFRSSRDTRHKRALAIAAVEKQHRGTATVLVPSSTHWRPYPKAPAPSADHQRASHGR